MKIIQTDKWYDPEGLNIPVPEKVFFEGTLDECLDKIDELCKKHNPSDRIYVSTIARTMHKGIYRPCNIEIYYMNAIAKKYYRIAD
jgi:hypothetical protein